MKHYIVLLDRTRIAGELRIPDFDHVWVEHPDTGPGECGNHLWRASMGVTAEVPVSAADLARCHKLQWLVVTGPSPDIVDRQACGQRGIEIVHLPNREKSGEKNNEQNNEQNDEQNAQADADALMDCLEALARR